MHKILFKILISNIFNFISFRFEKKIFSKEKIKKKSDTLFILGSGPSVRKIKDWNTIKKYDCVGFNFWCFHNFVPNYYFVEAPASQKALNVLKKILTIRSKDYKKTVFFNRKRWKSNILDQFFEKYKHTYYHIFSIRLNIQSKIIFKKFLDSKLFQYIKKFFFFKQGVSTIEEVVFFAYVMGYKKIVLCGVDLNSNDYFFDDKNFKHIKTKNIYLPKDHTEDHKKIHMSNDPKRCKGGIILNDVLQIYQKYVFKKDMRIFIYDNGSALKKILPLWPMRNLNYTK